MAWIDLTRCFCCHQEFSFKQRFNDGTSSYSGRNIPFVYALLASRLLHEIILVYLDMTASSNPTCEKDRYVGRALLDSDMHRLMNATMAHDVDNLNY